MKTFKPHIFNVCKTLLLNGTALLGILAAWTVHGAVASVSVVNYAFNPSTVDIQAGDEVIWTWASGSANHNVVSSSTPYAWLFPSPGGGPGTSSNQNSSNTRSYPFSFTNIFSSAGSFPYECTVHVSFGMVGTIHVAAAPVVLSVTITNPMASTVFSSPASFTLGAAASISSGSITNVQFKLGSVILTNCVSPPYAAFVTNLAAGTYPLSAIASADDGLSATNSINISVVNAAPIVIHSPSLLSSGVFQFSYAASVGLTYVVQFSTNLIVWTPLSTNIASQNPGAFSDSRTPSHNGFYRVVLQPNP